MLHFEYFENALILETDPCFAMFWLYCCETLNFYSVTRLELGREE